MDFLNEIKIRIKKQPKRLVLPESYDERMLKASEILLKEGYVSKLILIGDQNVVKKDAEKIGVDISKANIINPAVYKNIEKMAEIYFNKRKGKEVNSIEEAKKLILSDNKYLYFGALLLKMEEADAMVAGAFNTTADVLRASLRVIGVKKGFKTASSCFIILTDKKEYGNNGILVFADCATVPDPDEEQLAEIAITTAYTAKELLNIEPIVAMLSFSTRGSAKHPLVDKVKSAVEIVRKKAPELKIDGEMQLDAAIVKKVASKKAPDSKVAGNANVLIFPDLNAGNIGYKLVERLASATAIGPILQGFNKPVNDLSRGCSVDDIVNVSIITCLKA